MRPVSPASSAASPARRYGYPHYFVPYPFPYSYPPHNGHNHGADVGDDFDPSGLADADVDVGGDFAPDTAVDFSPDGGSDFSPDINDTYEPSADSDADTDTDASSDFTPDGDAIVGTGDAINTGRGSTPEDQDYGHVRKAAYGLGFKRGFKAGQSARSKRCQCGASSGVAPHVRPLRQIENEVQNLLELESSFEDEEFLQRLRQFGKRVAPALRNLSKGAGRVAGKAQKWARILGLVLHPLDQPALPSQRYEPGSEDRKPPISGPPPKK